MHAAVAIKFCGAGRVHHRGLMLFILRATNTTGKRLMLSHPTRCTPRAGPPGPIPADHAMLRRAELAKAADGAVAALVALLKRPAVDTLNGPLRIVAVQARG